jgi:hypothetical protein
VTFAFLAVGSAEVRQIANDVAALAAAEGLEKLLLPFALSGRLAVVVGQGDELAGERPHFLRQGIEGGRVGVEVDDPVHQPLKVALPASTDGSAGEEGGEETQDRHHGDRFDASGQQRQAGPPLQVADRQPEGEQDAADAPEGPEAAARDRHERAPFRKGPLLGSSPEPSALMDHTTCRA